MSKGIVQTIIGGLEVAVGIFLEFVPGFQGIGAMLIVSGAGMLLSGIGTLISGSGQQQQQQAGIATATRNAVAPRNVIYGRQRAGGAIVFINEFGESNKYLDIVIVLAWHPCEAVDTLLFDHQKVQIGANNTSFSPIQDDRSITDIARLNGVVTVTIAGDLTLVDGDYAIIHDISGDPTLMGKYPVIIKNRSGGNLTFTYLSGGINSHVTSEGGVKTAWPDYGNKVYFETLLGTQTLGETFAGMTAGTPDDGDPDNLITNPNNPWTANCSLVGTTAVMLRLHYDDAIFSNGIPQIGFLVRGKNDIYDPRLSPPGPAYTENAALCIADHLANQKWGFKAAYGTEIPTADLIAAANICDEEVDLAGGGTEPRYTCNGQFTLLSKRGEILRNLLTSCAGRLRYLGGKFVIQPGVWAGSPVVVGQPWLLGNATAEIRWRPTVSIADLYNGVKGTYVSAANNWQPSDFPRYAQDADHGYDDGAPEDNYDANLTADGGDRRWLDIQLPFTISSATAQRLAKIELLRRRHQGTGTFPLNMRGYKFVPLDLLSVTLAYFGWADQYLEIAASRFKLDRQQEKSTEVVQLGVEIDVQETDPSIYAWDIGEELSPQGYQQAIVPDNRTPKGPTNFRETFDEGVVVLRWDAPDDAYVLKGGHMEVRYQLIESPPGLWILVGKMDPSVEEARIPGLLTGALYYFQIRSVNAAGVPSPWIQIVGNGPEVPVPYASSDPGTQVATAELMRAPLNFGLRQSVIYDVNGVAASRLVASGGGVVNSFSTVTDSPGVALTTQSTGGTIPGGITVFVAVWVQDAGGEWTNKATASIKIPPTTNTNKVTVSFTFAHPLTDEGWAAITTDPQRGWVGTGAAVVAAGGTPTYVFTSMDDPLLHPCPVPDDKFNTAALEARTLYFGGMLAMTVGRIDIGSPSGKTLWGSGGFRGAPSGVNLAGRTLHVLARADATRLLPIFDVPVVSNSTNFTASDLATVVASPPEPTRVSSASYGGGAFTIADINKYLIVTGGPGWYTGACKIVSISGVDAILDRAPADAGAVSGAFLISGSVTVDDAADILEEGDLIYVGLKADVHTASTIGDTTLASGPSFPDNSTSPPGSFNAWAMPDGSGNRPDLSEDSLVGMLVMIIRGTGAGTHPVPIASNTATTITTAVPFEVTPDATSEFIVIFAVVEFAVIADPVTFKRSTVSNPVVLVLNVSNAWRVFFVQLFTVAPDGETSIMRYTPFRMIFQAGFTQGGGGTGITGIPIAEGVFGNGDQGTDGGAADIKVGGKTNLAGTFKVRIAITGWDLLAEFAPTGTDAVFEIDAIRGTDVIPLFTATYPAGGSGAIVQAGSFGVIEPGDILQGQITQADPTNPGKRFTLTIYGQRLASDSAGVMQ